MGTKQYDSATDLLTFSRASSATFLGSNGLLQTAANNVPRIEYDATGAVKGLLIEEARTNLITISGDLSGTGWAANMNRGAVTSGSPFGTYQTISPTANSNIGSGQIYQIGKTLTSGATYVGWALVKYSAGSGWFDINMYDTGDTSKRAYFDVQNGVVGVKDAANIDHGMVDYGDGWWLCWASANATSTSGGPLYEVPNGNGSTSCTTTDAILIAGTQYELGAFPTSYIPTTGATATRAIDIAEIPTSAFGYNNDAGSISVEFKSNKPSSLDYGAFVLSDGSPTNRILHFTSSTAHRVASINSNTIDVNIGAGSRGAPSELVKFAIAFAKNNFAASLNGATAVTDTSVTVPSGLSKLALGYFYPTNPNSNLLNGHIKSIQYYPRRLTNTQLQELTT